MPRGRQASGWASLTQAKQAVAGLVADGLTNPQIGAPRSISRRTVQTHLTHMFAKLDIASRAQLTAQVTRHRRPQPPPAPAAPAADSAVTGEPARGAHRPGSARPPPQAGDRSG